MTTLATPYWPTRDLPTNGHQPMTPIHPINLAQWVEPTVDVHSASADTAGEQPAQPNAKVVKLDAELETAARRASYMRTGFYVVVLNVALAGQVTGAIDALGIPLLAAIPAVAALEVGGIVVMQNADVRRRLGERATGSRILSALIAAWAVAFNWLAHDNHLLGGFFAGMSALGYLVWLMHTENQRRDRLRATGDLPATTPAYELIGHWLRHPWLTLRAKNLAKADERLGLYASIDAAKAEIRRERRDAAIATVVGKQIRKQSRDDAEIALTVYDLDEIAIRLKDRADYDGLTDMIAVRLDPSRFGDRAAQVGVAHVESVVGEPIDVGAHRPAHLVEAAPAQPTAQPMPAIDSAQPATPNWAAQSTEDAHLAQPMPDSTPTTQPTVQPTDVSPAHMGVGDPPAQPIRPRAAKPAQPTAHAQPPTPIPGLTDLQQRRLADLGKEFPGDLPGRDKVMAHMRAQGYEGWTSKEPARTLVNLLRAQRETTQPTAQPTPTEEAS